jgi:hypothetical protein
VRTLRTELQAATAAAAAATAGIKDVADTKATIATLRAELEAARTAMIGSGAAQAAAKARPARYCSQPCRIPIERGKLPRV